MGRRRSRKKDEWTTVSIKKDTKKMIDDIGSHGDNYDEILRRILERIKKG